MLHILLLILKIIGIVLLCILGVLLLCIACALFVPVRYRIEVVRKEGEGEPPVAVTVKVTWLLHFVNVLVRFTGSLYVRARLMVIPVFRLPKGEKPGGKAESRKAEKRRKKEKLPESRGTQQKTGTAPERKTAEESKADSPKIAEQLEKSQNTEESQTGGRTKTIDAAAGDEKGGPQAVDQEIAENSDKKPTLWEKLRAVPEFLRNIFLKIKGIFENIQYTIQKFCDKIRSVSDTIEYYKGVIEGEPFQRSLALCKKELLTIFKRLKPDRFEAALVVGMDDPAATGEILAVCGMLYPILGPKVNVVGDFEKKRLEGRVFIKGKLRFFTFLRVAVRIYFNKDIRKLYGLLKKEAV